jgi:hypothetical protein
MTTTDDGRMTKGERDELGRLLRKKVALAKHQIKERTADLLADFEEKLAAQYDPVDLGLRTALQEAQVEITRVVEELNTACDAKLEDLGVPKHFRGRGFAVSFGWDPRGENSTAARRTELRRVAQTAAAAAGKRAITAIETKALGLEERLVETQLRSHEAHRFLEALPTVEALMPPLSLIDVKRLASAQGARTQQERAAERSRYGYSLTEPALLAGDDEDEA